MVGSTFIPVDIEWHVANFKEIGLASIRITKEKPLPALQDGGLGSFYDQNEIDAHTIIVQEKAATRKREAAKFGDQVTIPKSDIGEALHSVLSNLEGNSENMIPRGLRHVHRV
jgi:hypothetical protein